MKTIYNSEAFPILWFAISVLFCVLLLLFDRNNFCDVRCELAMQILSARLRHFVACIGPNQKSQPNLDLYLVRRYKICHFSLVVSYLCIGQNQKNQPNLVLHLVRRSKIFVSVATLERRNSPLLRTERRTSYAFLSSNTPKIPIASLGDFWGGDKIIERARALKRVKTI